MMLKSIIHFYVKIYRNMARMQQNFAGLQCRLGHNLFYVKRFGAIEVKKLHFCAENGPSEGKMARPGALVRKDGRIGVKWEIV